jgi:hypothetical protein
MVLSVILETLAVTAGAKTAVSPFPSRVRTVAPIDRVAGLGGGSGQLAAGGGL